MSVHQCSRTKISIRKHGSVETWKHGSEDLKVHSILQYHKDCIARFKSFITTMKNIDSQIKNCEYIVSRYNKTKQNIYFISYLCYWVLWSTRYWFKRPQRRWKYLDNDDSNQENFRELVKLVAEIDNNLDTHLRTSAQNATYISKTK